MERKYGFRTDVSEVKDKLGKQIRCELTYLGSMGLYVVNTKREGLYGDNYTVHIEKIFEPPIYSTDVDINHIFVERYKTNMEEYYYKLFSDMFHPRKVINITLRRYGREDKYTLLSNPDYNKYDPVACSYIPDENHWLINRNIHSYLELINPKYIIRIINNATKETSYCEKELNTHVVYQIYTTDIFQ